MTTERTDDPDQGAGPARPDSAVRLAHASDRSADLGREYESLRAEMLQTYKLQGQLIFFAGLSAVGAVIGATTKAEWVWAYLAGLELLLFGITLKSLANYHRIFRIGSYLAVVHEQRGVSEGQCRLSVCDPAWHTRWRELSRRESWPKDATPPKSPADHSPAAEAWFIVILASVGWVAALSTDTRPGVSGAWVLLAFVLVIALLISLYFLRHVFGASRLYEAAFRALIATNIDPPSSTNEGAAQPGDVSFSGTKKTVESIKIFVLGVLVYASPSLFLSLGKRWFDELRKDSNPPWKNRAHILRRRLWTGFVLNLSVVGCTLLVLHRLGYLQSNGQYWLRVTAVIVLLTATLGRGGWAIESWKHNTIIERVDRGMYLIGQLAAAVLLLFALSL